MIKSKIGGQLLQFADLKKIEQDKKGDDLRDRRIKPNHIRQDAGRGRSENKDEGSQFDAFASAQQKRFETVPGDYGNVEKGG